MAKRTNIEEKADELYEKMKPDFGEIDQPTDSMLRSYALICAQVDNLNARLAREGFMVSDGDKKRENPVVGTLHKLNADKARYYTPLKRVLNKQKEEETDSSFESDDEFMGF